MSACLTLKELSVLKIVKTELQTNSVTDVIDFVEIILHHYKFYLVHVGHYILPPAQQS